MTPRTVGKVVVTVGEKGVAWRRLRFTARPATARCRIGADNALVKAAEVVERLATYRPAAVLDDVCRAYVDSLDSRRRRPRRAGRLRARSTRRSPPSPDTGWPSSPTPAPTRRSRPNVVHGGAKTNVIPDEVVLEVDIRTLPGQTGARRRSAARRRPRARSPPTSPSRRCTTGPARRARRTRRCGTPSTAPRAKVYPEATLLPRITAGGTDATFFRDAGSVAYGFGLLRRNVTYRGLLQPLPRQRRAHRRRVPRPHDRSAGSTSAVVLG